MIIIQSKQLQQKYPFFNFSILFFFDYNLLNPKKLIMDQQEEYYSQQHQIRQYYKNIQAQVQQKFRTLTTDTMQQIKNKMKRQQDKIDQQQNMNLIQKQRQRIIQQMQSHVAQCYHPHCQMVEQIIILYDLFKHTQKQDPVNLIVRKNVSGLAKIQTDCLQGAKINAKMKETHRLVQRL